MNNIYTGIGSRKTPSHILEMMSQIASKLESRGFILRSGGAPGADTAFEEGVKNPSNMEIYLPWKDFNNNSSKLYYFKDIEKAYSIASEHHKRWKYLKESVKKLMARNTYQILGDNLDIKTKFVICWTPCGSQSRDKLNKHSGGTGLAISLADSLDIKIFNLKNPKTFSYFHKFIRNS